MSKLRPLFASHGLDPMGVILHLHHIDSSWFDLQEMLTHRHTFRHRGTSVIRVAHFGSVKPLAEDYEDVISRTVGLQKQEHAWTLKRECHISCTNPNHQAVLDSLPQTR